MLNQRRANGSQKTSSHVALTYGNQIQNIAPMMKSRRSIETIRVI